MIRIRTFFSLNWHDTVFFCLTNNSTEILRSYQICEVYLNSLDRNHFTNSFWKLLSNFHLSVCILVFKQHNSFRFTLSCTLFWCYPLQCHFLAYHFFLLQNEIWPGHKLHETHKNINKKLMFHSTECDSRFKRNGWMITS